jgi:hypothetical protein
MEHCIVYKENAVCRFGTGDRIPKVFFSGQDTGMIHENGDVRLGKTGVIVEAEIITRLKGKGK